jgi:hypothetical protein
MTTKAKETSALVLVAAFVLIFYIRKIIGGQAIQLSPKLSLLVILLIALSLLWILILTIKGRFVERRIVFLYVGFAVALPLFLTLSQKIAISPEVEAVYKAVDELPAGSKILVSFDYDPPSAPELQPMAEAFLYYCFKKDLKVIMIALWAPGPQQANLAIEAVLRHKEIAAKNLQYGVDYVNLGYQAGNEFVIQRMGSDFRSMFPRDYRGTPYEQLPLVKNVKNFSNIDYCFNLSAGFPGTREWVQVAVDRYGARLGGGNTAVQAPQMYPFLRSGQLIGLLGGMSGAAEFEYLTKWIAKGTKFMISQSFAHMIVIAFIIIANVAFFKSGRPTTLRRAGPGN